MPSYLYEAIGPNGKKIQDRAEGESLAAANASLTALGYTDIVFFENDLTNDAKEFHRVAAGHSQAESEKRPFTPAQEIANRRHSGVWRKALWVLRKHLKIIALLLIIDLYYLTRISRLNALDYEIFAIALIGSVWMFLICVPGVCYQGILSASVWKDWMRMRRFIRIVRWVPRFIKPRSTLEYEFEAREAYALAAEGHLDQALQKMEELRIRFPIKPYLFLIRLGTVYENAEMPEKRIDCLREALESAPLGLATIRIGLASALAQGGLDIAGAKQLLAEAKAMEKTKLDDAGFAKCEGIIAVEEKKFTEAQQPLRKAITLFSDGGTPLVEWFICEIKAYLCLASAGLGQRDEASRLWREIKPLLLARNERDLVQRCATAAGDVSALRAP